MRNREDNLHGGGANRGITEATRLGLSSIAPRDPVKLLSVEARFFTFDRTIPGFRPTLLSTTSLASRPAPHATRFTTRASDEMKSINHR